MVLISVGRRYKQNTQCLQLFYWACGNFASFKIAHGISQRSTHTAVTLNSTSDPPFPLLPPFFLVHFGFTVSHHLYDCFNICRHVSLLRLMSFCFCNLRSDRQQQLPESQVLGERAAKLRGGKSVFCTKVIM